MAVGASPFGEMPSTAEILRRVRALMPDAGQNESDQHVVSQVVLKQFTEPRGQKRELLLARLSVRASGAKGSPRRPEKVRQDPMTISALPPARPRTYGVP